MYERFTRRARKVIRLATQAAKESHFEQMNIEHLLLAILRSEDGGAAAVLSASGVDRHEILRATEELMRPSTNQKATKMRPPALRAKRAIEYAIREQMYITHVGTEDLLLGITCEGESNAAQVLARFGLTRLGVRDQIRQLAAKHD